MDGISNKVEEFINVVNDIDPSIICLVETKLNDQIGDQEIFDTHRYNVYRKDRENQNAPGGGVAILIKKELISFDTNVRFLNDHLFNESVWCEISFRDKCMLIGCIYRAPSSSRENNDLLCDLIRLSDNYNQQSQMLICGDFNYNCICWEENSVQTNEQNSIGALKFLDAVNDIFLYQHVSEVTHNLDYNNPTRLDLVFTRDLSDIENIILMPPLGKSHHAMLGFSLIIDGEISEFGEKEIFKYNFHKGDYNGMRQELAQQDWVRLFEGKSVEEKFMILITILCNLTDKYVPKYKCSNKKTKPKWMTRDIREKIDAKEKAWKRLKARKTPLRAERYRQARNLVTSMVRIAKKVFDKKLCEDIKVNPKHFWSYVRSKTQLKDSVMQLRKRNGMMTENDKETADEFNKGFQSVFVKENAGQLPEMEFNYNGPLLENIDVEVREIEKLLKETNPNKAMGPDNIHPRLLKECHSELAVPVQMIIQESLRTGMVPTLWKLAKVCPIFKKGDRLDPLNYRPVSLTCIICKICETIIRNKIVEHLESNDLLSSKQHGFRQRRSTLTNLLQYMEVLTEAFDQQIPVDINYMDCRKAFDTVPHKRLLKKLFMYGIRGDILAWIKDFLSERQQFVEIRGEVSDKLEVTSGVPQGSVLGPVLFLLYINDLVENLECPSLLFADDAKVFVKIESEEDIHAMERDLKRLEEWSRQWLLEFNPNKCSTMHMGHRNPQVTYSLYGQDLKTSNAERDLGVLVTDDLKPAKHIGVIVSRANRMVGLIRRTFSYIDKEMCKTLYCSLVRPHIEYAVQSWSPFYRKDIIEMEKVQRRMTKLVPELRDLPYEERCRQLELTTLEKRRERGDLIEAYKIINGMENIEREDFFTFKRTCTRTNTMKLDKRGHWRTQIRANAFSVRVVNTWNSLPEDVVTAPSVSCFKRRLDNCPWGTRI